MRIIRAHIGLSALPAKDQSPGGGRCGPMTPSSESLRWKLRRYVPAEVLAIVAATACVSLTDIVANDPHWLVVAGIAGSFFGYYSIILVGEFTDARRETRRAMMRNLLLVYSSAELLDTLLFSPILLYACLHVIPSPQLAVVISEILGGIAFYSIVGFVHKQHRPNTTAHKQII